MQQVRHVEEVSSPTGRRRAELQQQGLGLLAARQRPVLPPGKTCGMWSFAIPWAPFAHYLETKEPDAKPFLWSQPFRLGAAEFTAFWGMERMEAQGGRLCVWMSLCNATFQPVNVYSKIEIWMPGSVDFSPCGEIFPVGDAVDTFAPCGGGSHGRFWWHLAPEDVKPNLFRAAFDSENERSFEVLISLKLDPHDKRTRSPAKDEDPKLFDFSRKYMEPWLHGIIDARISSASTPLQTRIAALEAESEGLAKQRLHELREAAEREEQRLGEASEQAKAELMAAEQRRTDEVRQLSDKIHQLGEHVRGLDEELAAGKKREEGLEGQLENAAKQKVLFEKRIAEQQSQLAAAAALEKQLRGDLAASQRREAALKQQLQAAEQREQALKQQVAGLQQQLEQCRVQLGEAARREAQLRQQVNSLTQQLNAAQQREDALRQRGTQLEKMLREGAEREASLNEQLVKINEYIQGTKTREERFRQDIAGLEGRAREASQERAHLMRQIQVAEGERRRAGELEDMLRVSNTRLLAAAVDEQGRVDAIHNSPQRQRMAQEQGMKYYGSPTR